MIAAHWKPYPATPPHTVTGELLRWPRAPFAFGGRRTLLVWLPPSYRSSGRRYPVLYMHDGQNLFDAATSFSGQEWQVDEAMTALAAEGLELIVVGVHHGGAQRVREYTPFPQVGGLGEEYVRWLAGPLKRRIDAEFRTLPDKQNTLIAGSSMGGLISAWAFFACPEVYGGAAIFSPAFWIAHGAIDGFLRRAPWVPGKLYLDHGTREGMAIKPTVDLLEAKGYAHGENLRYVVAKGARHNEAAWAQRFPDAVRWLAGGMADR